MSYDSITLAEKCLYVRERLGLTQAKFAFRIGCSQSYIAFIERGYYPSSCKAVFAVIRLLYIFAIDYFSDDTLKTMFENL